MRFVLKSACFHLSPPLASILVIPGTTAITSALNQSTKGCSQPLPLPRSNVRRGETGLAAAPTSAPTPADSPGLRHPLAMQRELSGAESTLGAMLFPPADSQLPVCSPPESLFRLVDLMARMTFVALPCQAVSWRPLQQKADPRLCADSHGPFLISDC